MNWSRLRGGPGLSPALIWRARRWLRPGAAGFPRFPPARASGQAGAFVIGINDLPAGRSAEAVSVLDLARLVRELCGSRMPGCIRRGSEIPVNYDDHPPAVLRLRAGALRGTRLCPAGAVTDAAREVAEIYTKASVPLVFRTREQIMQLFGGFELVDPGLVPLPEWRPEPRPCPPGEVWGLAGLGRVES
jgi:hypothetical protein